MRRQRLIARLQRLLRRNAYADFPLECTGPTRAANARLLDELPMCYRVFHDVCVEGVPTIDHVVVGPTGVFAMQSKDWTGHVTRDARGELTCNNISVEQDVRQFIHTIMQLRRMLALDRSFKLFIEAAFIIARATMPAPRPHHAKIQLYDANHTTHYMLREVAAHRRLDRRIIREIANKIATTHAQQKSPHVARCGPS